MITVIQRVRRAEVRVEGQAVGSIGPGLVALVAVVRGDTGGDLEYTADRIRHLRVFADTAGRMNLSVQDIGGSLLVVSQFTLAGETRKGRRPSFGNAAEPVEARRLYDELVSMLRQGTVPVETGRFAATMQLELINDGPVTLMIDSRQQTPKRPSDGPPRS